MKLREAVRHARRNVVRSRTTEAPPASAEPVVLEQTAAAGRPDDCQFRGGTSAEVVRRLRGLPRPDAPAAWVGRGRMLRSPGNR